MWKLLDQLLGNVFVLDVECVCVPGGKISHMTAHFKGISSPFWFLHTVHGGQKNPPPTRPAAIDVDAIHVGEFRLVRMGRYSLCCDISASDLATFFHVFFTYHGGFQRRLLLEREHILLDRFVGVLHRLRDLFVRHAKGLAQRTSSHQPNRSHSVTFCDTIFLCC